ncbi:MAG: hypothetical protein H6994_11760 [Pseudomonadales bacterium]|nr:hypothetical protein [Pseudomonadales bacterium]
MSIVFAAAPAPAARAGGAAGRGNLTPAQKKEFKTQKQAIKKRERAAIRDVDVARSAVRRLERDKARADRQRQQSKARLMTRRGKLQNAENKLRLAGDKASRRLVRSVESMRAAYAKAEQAHVNGPRARALVLEQQLGVQSRRLADAGRLRDQARGDLVVRKNNKNAKRQGNLLAAQQRKAMKKAAGRPASVPGAVAAARLRYDRVPPLPVQRGLRAPAPSAPPLNQYDRVPPLIEYGQLPPAPLINYSALP